MYVFRNKYDVLTLILIILSFSLVHIDSAVSKQNSNNVVAEYINALSTGDTETLKKCLGERLQQRRQKTLEDPSYSSFLIDYYSGATFRIIRETNEKKGRKSVDVEITFESNDILTIRLILNSSNKIIDEIIL